MFCGQYYVDWWAELAKQSPKVKRRNDRPRPLRTGSDLNPEPKSEASRVAGGVTLK